MPHYLTTGGTGIPGTVRLEPVTDQETDPYHLLGEEGYTFKPYYVVHTKINTLALLDESKGVKGLLWMSLVADAPRDTFSGLWPEKVEAAGVAPASSDREREPSTCVAPH